jgi:HlyD family secretion protein
VLLYTDGRPDKPYHGKIGFVSPTAEFTPKTVETPDLRTDLVYRLRIIVTDADDAAPGHAGHRNLQQRERHE